VVVEAPQPHREKVVDIMEALKQSLAVAKKPAASAASTQLAADAKPAKRRARG